MRAIGAAQGDLVTHDHFDARLEKFENRFEHLELRLTVKLGVLIAAGIGLVTALLRLHG